MSTYEPSTLAQLAERLNVPAALVRKTAKAIAELPPGVRDALLEHCRFPHASSPRAATLEGP